MKVISISAKCSDLFSAVLEQDGRFVGEYHGYVPEWIGDNGSEDYVEMTIDVETGQIIGWQKPTDDDLISMFEEE